MTAEWVHFQTGDTAFPTFDLDFVRDLIGELTTRVYATGGAIPGAGCLTSGAPLAGLATLLNNLLAALGSL